MILVILLDLRTIDLPCNYRGRRCLCRARTRSRWRELRAALGGYASAVSRRIFSGIARPDGASGHGQRQGCACAHTGVWSASAALIVVSAACGMYGSMCHEYGAFALRGANSRVEVDRIFTRVPSRTSRRRSEENLPRGNETSENAARRAEILLRCFARVSCSPSQRARPPSGRRRRPFSMRDRRPAPLSRPR